MDGSVSGASGLQLGAAGRAAMIIQGEMVAKNAFGLPQLEL